MALDLCEARWTSERVQHPYLSSFVARSFQDVDMDPRRAQEKESCVGKPGNSALGYRKDAKTLRFCFPLWKGHFLPCGFASHLPVYFPLL